MEKRNGKEKKIDGYNRRETREKGREREREGRDKKNRKWNMFVCVLGEKITHKIH